MNGVDCLTAPAFTALQYFFLLPSNNPTRRYDDAGPAQSCLRLLRCHKEGKPLAKISE